MNLPRLFSSLLLSALLPLSSACDGKDEGEGDDTGAAVDRDGDGSSATEDCDDSDPRRSPDLPELCDGLDNDCDGDVDEDVGAIWYADVDGDGYGDDETGAFSCEQPEGYVSRGGDCDDAVITTHPAGLEICDGEDQDCDGQVDEEALNPHTWFMDADGDGHGDPNVTFEACEAGPFGATIGNDCDDAAPEVYPGAPELCDGVDNDCDGFIDDSPVDPVTWYRDRDGDGYGESTTTLEDCQQPSGYVDASGDCDDADGSVWPDAPELCDGVDHDCDGAVNEANSTDARDWYPDVDGDGYGDSSAPLQRACLRPSEHWGNNTDCDDTEATVYPNAPEVCDDGLVNDCNSNQSAAEAECGLVGDVSLTDAAALITGEASGDHAGYAMSALGDSDGDGLQDLVVGAYQHQGGALLTGGAYVVPGGQTGTVGLGTVGAQLEGEVSRDFAGWAVAGPGDVDGDGYADVLVGAYGNDHTTQQAGSVYLLYGPVTSQTLGDTGLRITGEDAFDKAGWAVSAAGDVDGDGWADLVVGAPGQDTGDGGAGAAYLVLGDSRANLGSNRSLADADALMYGSERSEGAGGGVAGGGDVNGDGYDDLLVSADGADDSATDSGTTWLMSGPLTGVLDLRTDATAQLMGETASDRSGTALALCGDLNGDGYDELMVGTHVSGRNGANAGAAYVFFGPTNGDLNLSAADAILHGDAAGDAAGRSLACAGDVDQDGAPDLLVGATQGDSSTATDLGVAYLVLGPVTAGTVSLATAPVKLAGGQVFDYAGSSVAGVGDFDGTGSSMVAVGAYGEDSGGAQAGAVFIIGARGF